ncbi:U1 snRNP-associated protein usp106-like [Bidens hawaiensis]|uniref:U1 snRNP-associated protein usp106-like n=1 Tax=Bidens hawaiensis TaxID=980011 RepID=UPI0040491A42
MDAIRKQLDVLMGANRNGDVTEVNRKYYDRDVCRLFLAGLCPHELFQLTKMDMGPCPKVHSFQLRKEYQEAKAKGQDNYDRELEDLIDRLIVECDRKIARALKRLSEEDAKAAIAISVSEVTQTPEILELSKQIKEKLKEADQCDLEGKADMKIRAMEIVEELRIQRADKQSMLLLDAFNKDRASLPQPLPNPPPLATLPVANPDARTQELINEKLKKAEDLGEQGMLDEAQKALEEAEALKKLSMHFAPRQEPVTDSSKFTAADVRVTDQKLRVCDICGAFLSVYDSDRRLADHFGGKLHLGYMQIREKLADLLEERTNRRKVPEDDRRSKERSKDLEREGSRDRVRASSRDRDRTRDSDRRSRDRHHDRDRGYERDRERDRDSRSRHRSRSRDRVRDYDRPRRYDRY